MANNPFDRTIIHPREKPLSQDINRAQSQLYASLTMMAREMFSVRSAAASLFSNTDDNHGGTRLSGCIGMGLSVNPTSPASMAVVVKAGLGFFETADSSGAIGGVLGLDDLDTYKPIVLPNDVTFTVPTAPGFGLARYDIIEAKLNRAATDPTSRLVLDPATGAFNPEMLDKTLAFELSTTESVVTPTESTAALSYKQGTPAASPTVPPTSTGYVRLGTIYVPAGYTSITPISISDQRPMLFPGGVVNFSARWNVSWNGGTPTATLRRISAPPGVKVVLVPSTAQRGKGTIYVIAGTHKTVVGTCLVTPSSSQGTPWGAAEGVMSWTDHYITSGNDTCNVPVDSTLQTALNAGSPNTPTGIGQLVSMIAYDSRYQTAGTTNVTSAVLDTIGVQVNGTIRF